MSELTVYERLSKFQPYEQLVLMTSRYLLTDDEKEYISKLVQRYDMNWDAYLGCVLINRVNGVVYKNIRDVQGIPKYVKYFLKVAHKEQIIRTTLHQKEIAQISQKFEEENISHSFLKGAVLNTIFYEPGDRISNDTDIMIEKDSIDKVVSLTKEMGYIQGLEQNGEIVPATKKEILFARLNTYEIIPMLKYVDPEHLPIHELDINFRLSNDDAWESTSEMLADTILLHNGERQIRTLSLEKFLLFMCIHHYREACMIYKIIHGNDLTLYKFMDIHFLVSQKKDETDWKKLLDIATRFERIRDVYYTFYYTERLYPGTFPPGVLEMFRPEDTGFIDEYKGKDNTSETYKWEMSFEERALSYKRKVESVKNIEDEFKRFQDIISRLN